MKYEGTANNLIEAREKAVEIIKKHIKSIGVIIPIKGNFTYSNDKLDGWFRLNEDGKVKKFNRDKGAMEDDK